MMADNMKDYIAMASVLDEDYMKDILNPENICYIFIVTLAAEVHSVAARLTFE
jgi:hypothetical protein